MRIPKRIADEIVAHSREEAPNECCGLVSGRKGVATEVFRARNEMASPLAYNVHPQDLLRITEAIESRGEELAAIYHSHTRSPAEPSQTDDQPRGELAGSRLPDLLRGRSGGAGRPRLGAPRRPGG